MKSLLLEYLEEGKELATRQWFAHCLSLEEKKNPTKFFAVMLDPTEFGSSHITSQFDWFFLDFSIQERIKNDEAYIILNVTIVDNDEGDIIWEGSKRFHCVDFVHYNFEKLYSALRKKFRRLVNERKKAIKKNQQKDRPKRKKRRKRKKESGIPF